MALVFYDRVRETTTVTGTSDATLLGAVTGFQAFSVVGNGNTCYYTIADQSGGNWEVGIGTYSTTGPTLQRTTILSSSNSGNKVSFGAGTKDVFLTYPSEKAAYLDESDYLGAGGSSNISLNGNLTFVGARRIIGDFSNATVSNRVAFQTSTTNGNTVLEILPNGTATTSGLIVESDSAATNGANLQINMVGGTDARIVSGIRGTGTYLPLTMYTGGSERLRIDTAGNVGIGVTPNAWDSTQRALQVGAVAHLRSDTVTTEVGSNAYFSSTGWIYTTTGTASTYAQNNGSHIWSSAPSGTAGTPITFSNASMQLNSAGSLSITAISNPTITVHNNAATNVANTVLYDVRLNTTTSNRVMTRISHGFGDNTDASRSSYIAFQTNASGGLGERMRIAANTFVGIGTSAPTAQLSLYGSGQTTGAMSTSTGLGGTLILQDSGGAPGNGGAVIFGANQGNFAAIKGFITDGATNTTGDLLFSTRGNTTDATLTERMRLTAAGNVGIGTSSPNATLHLGAGGASIRIGISASNQYGELYRDGPSGNIVLNAAQASFGNLVFQTTSVEHMRISSSGLVGIATSSPGTTLDVNGVITVRGTAGEGGEIRFNNAANSGTALLIDVDSANNTRILNATASGTLLYSNGVERFQINSSGDVLMGNASTPGNALRYFDIYNTNTGASAGSIIRLITSDVAGTGSATVDIVKYKNGSFFINNNETNTAAFTAFGVGLSERMRIDSSGRVGIGTSSPTSRLTVTNGGIEIRDGNSLLMRPAGNANDTRLVALTTNGLDVVWGGTPTTSMMHFSNASTIGIGTSSPGGGSAQTKLQVVASNISSLTTQANVMITTNDAQGVDVGAILGIGGSVTTAAPNNNMRLFGAIKGAKDNSTDGATSGYMSFLTMGAGTVTPTERMRIDSSGNVGIGTSSPTVRLQTNGAVSIQGTAGFPSSGVGIELYYDTTNGSHMQSYDRTASAWKDLRLNSGLTVFSTAGSERMRITAAGELLVGQTAADGKVVSNSGSAAQRSYHGGNLDANCNTDGVYYAFVNRARTTAFNFFAGQNTSAVDIIIYGNGNIVNTNGSYGTISDVKNKENIVDATPKLEKINQLKVRNFNFKGDDLKQIGFVAQEFEQVFPSMVEETPDRDEEGNDLGTTTKSIKTSVLIPILVKAMQEQQAMIEELKARIETLEAK